MSDYVRDVIQRGDLGSSTLRETTAPSLHANSFVRLARYGGKMIAGLKAPEGHVAVVHSASGDYGTRNPVSHARSMVEKLTQQAKILRTIPAGFADVVDSNSGADYLIRDIGEELNNAAINGGWAVLNGENAILGDLINPEYRANLFGTAISFAKEGEIDLGSGEINDVRYFAFDPRGQFIFANSDGQGTKSLIHARNGNLVLGVQDSLAMKIDDSAKHNADVLVVWDNVEMNVPLERNGFLNEAERLGSRFGFTYLLDFHHVGRRIQSDLPYGNGIAYNISGNAVCTISEESLRSPLSPKEGDTLVAIKARGPRSNGITKKREVLVNLYGREWHLTDRGKDMLEFVSQPSIIFYGVFKELIAKGLASSVYHMSGGAYDSKLAKPLAENGLFVNIREDGLFAPDRREIFLAERASDSVRSNYIKFPMGNEGFYTTSEPERSLAVLRSWGLEGKVAGSLEECDRVGIELSAYNGERISFP